MIPLILSGWVHPVHYSLLSSFTSSFFFFFLHDFSLKTMMINDCSLIIIVFVDCDT